MSLAGRQIGRYRILEQVGQGGMSVVYRGLDTMLEREVAVKVLHPHLANKLESRKRLEREAKAVARLKHPNILEVYDFAGADAEEAYIVTEFIRGKTLRQFITDESLQPPELAAMAVHEIASALAHAHEAGIIHRDLKPENVMVRDDGVLKLMDFGIAKILDKDEKMTMTGALVGSPAHMAPEIIEGEEAGAEADVFSLGTMLYLFSTGKLPFQAPNTTATLKKILDCAYDDPRQVVPTVSDELAEIIATCLQRQPGNRYPTASKLRDALAELLSGLGITRCHEELPKFFLDPRAYRKELVPRVTQALLARAEGHIAERKSARALSALNQVLAHDPSNSRASSLLGQMKARKVREQRTRRLVRLSTVTGVGFIVAASAWQGFAIAMRAPDYHLPALTRPTDVVLTNVTWPTPPKVEADDAGMAEVDAGVVEVLVPDAGQKRHGLDGGGSHPAVTGKPVALKVQVRPWGFLTIDNGPRSADMLPEHQLTVTPGPHTFLVTCEACEEKGVTRVETISADRTEPLTLVAPLKPSLLSFRGGSPNSTVRVRGQSKLAAETLTAPFTIKTPLEGSRINGHLVDYELIVEGAVVAKATVRLTPGQSMMVDLGAPH